MSAVVIPYTVPNPIHSHKYCDNNHVPHVSLYRLFADHLNKTGRWQPKMLWRSLGDVVNVPAKAGGGNRNRWRFAGHTGVFCAGLVVDVSIAQSGVGDPFCRAAIDSGDSYDFYYGTTAGTPTDSLNELGHFSRILEIADDTDFTFTFSDWDNGRLASAVVYELTFESDTDFGYLPGGHTINQPIYDEDREQVAELAYEMWKRNGSPCFHWSSDTDATAFTRTSTTDINLVDNSSTAVSASTPGFTLDERYRNTLMLTTVPIKVRVYGSCAGGGTGHVYIKNSAGTVLATVNINSATPGWFDVTWNAPATMAKYDVHVDSDGVNLTTVNAVSVFQYLA